MIQVLFRNVMYIKHYKFYEGCSNMNASSFITFVTYMLWQNGIRFYKGLYVTFKLAPDLKINTVYLSSYSPLNEGHFIILTNPMLQKYQWFRQAYNSSINRWNLMNFFKEVSPYNYKMILRKLRKSGMFFVKIHRILFTEVSLCLQINDKQNTTFQFSVNFFSTKMHDATFKLVLTQRHHVDRSNWVVATNHWRIVGNF